MKCFHLTFDLKNPLIFGGVLFLFVMCILLSGRESWAAKQESKTTVSVMTQAEELVLDSKRTEALLLLSKAWSQASGQEKNLLAKKMDDLARVFLSERGQKAFELGQSMVPEKAELAEGHYLAALQAEDNNVSVLFALTALKIREKNWAQALERLDSIIQIVPSSRRAEILKTKTLLAAAQLDAAEKALQKLSQNGKTSDLEELEINLLIQREKYPEAKAKLAELIKKQPEDSELYFLNWRLARSQKELGLQSAAKYLELCKKWTTTSLKLITEEPFKCLEQSSLAKIVDEFESQTR